MSAVNQTQIVLDTLKDLKDFVFEFERGSQVDCLYVKASLNLIDKYINNYLEVLKLLYNKLEIKIVSDEENNEYLVGAGDCYYVTVTKEEFDKLKETLE